MRTVRTTTLRAIQQTTMRMSCRCQCPLLELQVPIFLLCTKEGRPFPKRTAIEFTFSPVNSILRAVRLQQSGLLVNLQTTNFRRDEVDHEFRRASAGWRCCADVAPEDTFSPIPILQSLGFPAPSAVLGLLRELR